VLGDPDRNVLADLAAQFSEKYSRKVETEPDLRRVFERKDTVEPCFRAEYPLSDRPRVERC
jgi:hypothetical protein